MLQEATATRPSASWFQRWPAIAVFCVVGLVIASALAHNPTTGPHIDSGRVESDIESTLSQRGIQNAVVSCPSNEPIKANSRFVCSLNVNGQQSHVLVTVVNDNGDIQWIVTG
jgi:hypothetical protein